MVLGISSLEGILVPISFLDFGAAGDLLKCKRPTSRGVLEVLPVGPLPPNPGEFVGSQLSSHWLRSSKSRADLLLIDAPPILNLGDT